MQMLRIPETEFIGRILENHPEIGEKEGEVSGVAAGAEVVTAVVAGDEAAEVSTEEAAAVAEAEDVGAGE